MKCPNCSAAAPENAAECPSCGVIFAKLLARREKEKAAAAAALLDAPSSAPPADPRRTRLIAITIVVFWVMGLAVFVQITVNRGKTPGYTQRPKRTVQMRDPVTGQMKTLPIVEAAPRRKPQQPASN